MAKKSTETTTAAPATASTNGFSIETMGPPPATTRGFGSTREPSPFLEVMRKMAPPSGDNYSTFFVPVQIADSITDPKEQEKARKDEARKVQNRISSVSRRLSKENPDSVAFAIRSTHQVHGDTNSPYGVRVWRVNPTVKPAPQAQANAGTVPPPPQA